MKNVQVSEIEKFVRSHFSRQSDLTVLASNKNDRPELYVIIDNYSDYEVLTDDAKIEFEQFFEAEFVDTKTFSTDMSAFSEGTPRIYSLEISIS